MDSLLSGMISALMIVRASRRFPRAPGCRCRAWREIQRWSGHDTLRGSCPTDVPERSGCLPMTCAVVTFGVKEEMIDDTQCKIEVRSRKS